MANFELTQTGEQVQQILNDAPTEQDVADVAADLATETTNRENADTTLQGNIDAEETARENADSNLQEQINGKQPTLTFDFAPTAGSTNPVYSGGVKSALDQKQDNLTFDNEPTQHSSNPVKSGAIYDIWQALLVSIATNAGDIDTIEGKIPAAASNSNQLADKAFVNSSISTNTATFRGTSAAGLTEAQFLAWANGLTHDKEDYVFWNTTDAAGTVQYKRYKYNGSEWLYEYTLNNSSFTSAQWAAINSAITSGDVEKLAALPTRAQLDAILESYYTKTQVDGLVVYDISAANNGETYADLEAALGPNGANVPVSARKSGMIKFVRSSDNKYVSYWLMATSFSTNEDDWQCNDTNVENLNGGDFAITDENDNKIVKFTGGHIKTKNFNSSKDATTSERGLMSATDKQKLENNKTKLDTIEEGAEVNDVETANSDKDLDLVDERGLAVFSVNDGHIKSKNFDSSTDAPTKGGNVDYSDFCVSDETNNTILKIKNGYPRTKNFDGKAVKEKLDQIDLNQLEQINEIQEDVDNISMVIDDRKVFDIHGAFWTTGHSADIEDGEYFYNIKSSTFYKRQSNTSVDVTSQILPIVDTLIFHDTIDNHLYIYNNGTMMPYTGRVPRIELVHDDTLFDTEEEIQGVVFGSTIMEQIYAKFDALLTNGENLSKLSVTKLDAVTFANEYLSQEEQLEYPEYANGVTDYHEGDGTVPAYKTYIYKISNEQTTVGYSAEYKKHRIFIIGGVHGVERFAMFNTYLFAKNLLSNYTTNINFYKILASCDIYILPVLNGYGSIKATRYNANGVDIARNAPTPNWVLSEQPYELNYSGPSAGSEFETKLYIALATAINPDVFVDHHNYGALDQQFYVGSLSLSASRAWFDAAISVAQMLNKHYSQYFGNKLWLPNNRGTMELATTHPVTPNAWFYSVYKLQLSMTVEISQGINYNEGVFGDGQMWDNYGSDSAKIGEFTLRQCIYGLVKNLFENNN